MELDWRRLRAVVIESDDWGLCAWSPDEEARRLLLDTPAWRSPAGIRYGGSTLESAAHLASLGAALREVRGGDGLAPVWQANTVVAAPDYARLAPPRFHTEELPLVDFPDTPSRWSRRGLREAVDRLVEEGVWWPELHGLHHLPEAAWLAALRRGDDDARRAFAQQSPICRSVEASGEYAAAEPRALRVGNLRRAVERFRRLFGRTPGSFCPPDYHWDPALDAEAESLGLVTFQGRAEAAGAALPRLRRMLLAARWPRFEGARFVLPPRIAFEPMQAEGRSERLGVATTRRAVRAAWAARRPAVVSTHRVNYAHLDPGWAASGLAALRELLAALAADRAVFLTDAEVRALVERDWSLRPIGARRALLRYYGEPRQPIAFSAPMGVERVAVGEAPAGREADVTVADGRVTGRFDVGEHLLEWSRA